MDISGIPYQLRVDLPIPDPEEAPYGPPELREMIGRFKQYSKLMYYLVGYEISKSGKHHMQCIVWYSEPLTQINMSKYRNWWKQEYASRITKQPVSFTKSIAPDRLLSYCNKDGMIVSNLSQELISKIPMWREKIITDKDSEKQKQKKRSQFNEMCKKIHDDIQKEGLADFYFRERFLTEISKSYFTIYNSPMRRNIGLTKLFEFKLMSHNQYIRSLYNGLFFFN